jgi:hypothetical protein
MSNIRELDELNRKIQVQRNIEMHAALERVRLETQRVELLLRLQTPAAAGVPYQVTVRGVSSSPAIPERAIGQPIPQLTKLPVMIKDALQSAPDGLLPKQIIEAVHQRGSQTTPALVYRTINTMLKGGRIGRVDKRYSVPRSNGMHP